ncbi:hypothetical protein Desaci_0395 [Desulfosporosinus acidiphilus SJ4]|uniref:Uncharacterized protein n=1 Tax=Desulfosporosinus acidiphilus (strain DSM 22704 / JCM 16185 / SJ4) TaxID=646529 RepID=I4D0Y8_DESAJ|nr:hypothetical protein [Desulfosporosinus acidiphilus]AFM39462.1 hypothetical protein Desaci_0395 [Desulfosporosinus acidiphilus SJ4]
MNINNETCVQRVIIQLYHQNFPKLKNKNNTLITEVTLGKDVKPEDVRAWKNYLTDRLERIAQMMEILLNAHDDWAITGRKGFVQMETQSFEVNNVIRILSEHGFHKDEYIIKLDYTRKWGVL